ncbi:glycine-rich RNA-binding protein 1 [Brachypodium distachyon]|uniref:RRM domain-containing protein n=1 Tax=Brachypodium distachyon TaxID=15368 RepID=I1I3R9_BRADI|nr:glycine-rich RNA-binding protein 1 [Brachypodium distachyon]XP_024317673.1 glycine-rich RNA-binding protein 1 [Brachypodium distachyon]KQJ96556.1 hypothetical protein BRADI_3g24720v3 [Brachypodium distachyon]KQJ96557.1 hypothetical protein BRADI_3g24720v3 [Brachypodium distachyon]|eukprot:XP_010234702.1 glycine-rich RNA-binding protein 1 [Brachypodium distachyon]
MAFLHKAGSLLKRSIGSGSPLLQTVRCMSSSKVFIGGVSYGTDGQSLADAFSQYGQVVEAKIIMDRETGRSRGFGFVTYTSAEEAGAAITGMDGKDLQGRIVRVSYAHDRGSRAGVGVGGGYGGIGYNGGGGGYTRGGGGGGYNDGSNFSLGYNTGGNYGVPGGGQGGYGVPQAEQGGYGGNAGGAGGYSADGGKYSGDYLNQGGGEPAPYGGGNYGAINTDNATVDAPPVKFNDLLSDLKDDDAGK